MKILIFTGLFVGMLFNSSNISAQEKAKESVEKVLMNYLEGTNKLDAERVGKAFTMNSVIFVATDGEALTFPASYFVERVKNGESGGDEGRKIMIESIDLMKTHAASARVKAETEDSRYDHIISLINDNGSWAIISVIIKIDAK